MNSFLEFINVITGFEVLDYEAIVTELGYIPEEEPYTLNF